MTNLIVVNMIMTVSMTIIVLNTYGGYDCYDDCD